MQDDKEKDGATSTSIIKAKETKSMIYMCA
jgi:hypothetical protein